MALSDLLQGCSKVSVVERCISYLIPNANLVIYSIQLAIRLDENALILQDIKNIYEALVAQSSVQVPSTFDSRCRLRLMRHETYVNRVIQLSTEYLGLTGWLGGNQPRSVIRHESHGGCQRRPQKAFDSIRLSCVLRYPAQLSAASKDNQHTRACLTNRKVTSSLRKLTCRIFYQIQKILHADFLSALMIFTFSQIIDDEICEVENSVDTVQITTNSEPASKIDIEDDYPKDDFTPLQAANSGEIVEVFIIDIC